MTEEDKSTADMIRDGTYFKEARAWYNTLYIGPISERSFFLIVAALAIFIAVVALKTLISLTPLVARPGMLVPANPRQDEVIAELVPLKDHSEKLDFALARFFVIAYLSAREGYTAGEYQSNAAFVHAQSADEVYNAFSSEYSASNPASPAAKLGGFGARNVQIDTLKVVLQKDGGEANAGLMVEEMVERGEPSAVTKWRVKMTFRYTPMKIETIKNTNTGVDEIKTTDPQFQVLSYAVSKV